MCRERGMWRRIRSTGWLIGLICAGSLCLFGAAPAGGTIQGNSNPITITDNSTALPYPSVIEVPEFEGALGQTRVTLNGFSHPFPNDVDILIGAPGSAYVELMSDTCDGVPISGQTFTFSDTAPDILPNGPCLTGTYKPTNREPAVDAFPGAPAVQHSTLLVNLNRSVVPGTWRLFVVDDAVGASGSIAGGWSLELIPATRCSGQAATSGALAGTSGRDVLIGTAGEDVILGLGGKDVIRGRGGNDRICGGAGRDRLFGGPGQDVIHGQSGPDKLRGQGGDKDLCVGGHGRDTTRSCEKGKLARVG